MVYHHSALGLLQYVMTVLAPSILFTVVSLPVQKRNLIQDGILALLWFAGLFFPIYYAGQYSYVCSISVSVWAWATAMKMGVWVFCMTMEERQKRPFIYTLSEWRQRLPEDSSKDQQKAFKSSFDYREIHFARHLWIFIKHQVIFDLIDFIYNYDDAQRPIRVFSAFMSKIYEYAGQMDKAASLASSQAITYTEILISTCQSLLFCVYIQIQLQVTYDALMLMYATIYKCLPYLERWQLGATDLRDLNSSSRNVLETKAILRRVKRIRAVKDWIEDTLTMQPLFNSPWTAHSLRDFWGRRWHTFYNESFYRLGYRPIRWTMLTLFKCKPPRWLPALSVFVMSGLMHEFFLFSASGPRLYTGSSSATLPAGGLQFLFFIVQVFGISIGDRFFRGGPLGRAFTLFFAALTCHLFVVPYLLTGYLYMERFSFLRIVMNLCRGNRNILASTF
ncbi:hypothetical protein BDF20DRAFT_870777 [Mycotypha africana]|uniref:uncharacterized protein n=1 Tax=Mycotypha africana TaxID=64632 RepID=UPI002301CEDA|nr:uncharacterized protein BDF20DRAFT_870777 [Mycotypha africana]KAI8979646.1 hypothetical protein BDF20DRAFT_870777 [Mycotypha africana]